MKSIIKTMTNNDIYNLALGLINAKFEESDIYIPAAINFVIQKNKMALLEIAEEVEKNRIAIIQHYGEVKDDGTYIIPTEKIDKANNELKELLDIEQEIKLYQFKVDMLESVQLTYAQMEAIMFMIED